MKIKELLCKGNKTVDVAILTAFVGYFINQRLVDYRIDSFECAEKFLELEDTHGFENLLNNEE